MSLMPMFKKYNTKPYGEVPVDYTPEMVWAAYNDEHQARKIAQKNFNREVRATAQLTKSYLELRESFNVLADDYLRLHIEKNVKFQGDQERTLDEYFASDHCTFYTTNGGYLCVQYDYSIQGYEDCIFIAFAWSPLGTVRRQEYKDFNLLLKSLLEEANQNNQKVLYTGLKNVLRNHSVQIEKDLWELKEI